MYRTVLSNEYSRNEQTINDSIVEISLDLLSFCLWICFLWIAEIKQSLKKKKKEFWIVGSSYKVTFI